MAVTTRVAGDPATRGALAEILRKGLLRSVFQPIVDLESRVLLEALALCIGPRSARAG